MDKISCNTHFLGVVPCDHLPDDPLRTLPAMVIINTHPSGLPGEHWLSIYINKYGVGCFFDSFGNRPDHYRFPHQINDFLNLNSVTVQYSAKQVQDFSTDTCGQHCVFFLYNMCMDREYENVLKKYTDDLLKNDNMVSCFVKKIKPSDCYKNVFKCVQCVQTGYMFV